MLHPKKWGTHYKRFDMMLQWQRDNFPKTPTIRDLMALWKLRSENTVKNTLNALMAKDLVRTFKRGQYKGYYAVDDKEEE